MSLLSLDTVLDMGPTYADCLRAMNEAARRGMEFDVPAVFVPLVDMDAAALEALISMERGFSSQARSRELRKSKRNGIRTGRPPRELPPGFYEAVERWSAGELSCNAAARSCGMPPSTFRKQARLLREPLEPRVMDAETRSACECWARGEISKAQAAARARLSPCAFAGVLRANGITRRASLGNRGATVPSENFTQAVALWEAGKISRKKAAAMCGVSEKRFSSCLRRVGKPLHVAGEKRDWEEAVEAGVIEVVWARWLSGELTKKEAARACGLGIKGFNSALRHLGKPWRRGKEREMGN